MVDMLKSSNTKKEIHSIRQLYEEANIPTQERMAEYEMRPGREYEKVEERSGRVVMSEVESQDFLLQCRLLRERIERLIEKYEKILNSSKAQSFTHRSLAKEEYVSKEMPYLFYKPWKKATNLSQCATDYGSPSIRDAYKKSPRGSVDRLETEKEHLLDECVSLRSRVKELEGKSGGSEEYVKRLECLENRVGKLAEVVTQWASQTMG
eukprot:TRINITY_DN920_c0_g4_i2.p1 TRINITY_DN920_c0_g4~~TRINITY_DN920_c0_g4_i2.p1  ORF type:complete len:208 (+),score=63.68 TRINITY_DN920_c0_g4_i2:604-1227(+)